SKFSSISPTVGGPEGLADLTSALVPCTARRSLAWVGPTSPPTFNPAYSPGLFATFGRA
ncbi:hypothetical protein M885DRAFT_542283, partial [Pelagophyceae sp. CCMP2097]